MHGRYAGGGGGSGKKGGGGGGGGARTQDASSSLPHVRVLYGNPLFPPVDVLTLDPITGGRIK